MAYTPDFTRSPKGKFNPDCNFISLQGGTNAYLLEDEVNELQFIQEYALSNTIRKITYSGVLTKVNADDDNALTAEGAPQALAYKYEDTEATPITSSEQLNRISINPFTAILDGHVTYISGNNNSPINVSFIDPYTTGQERQDFVILEFWYKQITQETTIDESGTSVKTVSPIYQYGGVNNRILNPDSGTKEYSIIDPRMAVETTDRVQLQWRIRSVADKDNIDDDDRIHYNPYGSELEVKVEEMLINPMTSKGSISMNYTYRTSEHDPYLFITGTGSETDKTILGTIDGYIYAIPLFNVKRLNSTGYDINDNINGGLKWTASTDVSDRITLDGKFSNAIYKNDIIDVRHLAPMGKLQYDEIYTSNVEFEKYRKEQAASGEETAEAISEMTVLIDDVDTKIDTVNQDLNQSITQVSTTLNNTVVRNTSSTDTKPVDVDIISLLSL